MADSAVGKLIPLAIVGALGYWAYEMFFAHPAAAASSGSGVGPGTNLVPNTGSAVVAPPAPAGPCPRTGILAGVLDRAKRSAGANAANYGEGLPGAYTIDEWDYFVNQGCTGLADDAGINADTLFPGRDDRGGPLNWSAFVGFARQAGLSGSLGTNLRRRR